MSNYLNLSRGLAHARLRNMLRPDIFVDAVDEVQPDFLKAQGIKALLLDLDDTLVASNATVLTESYRTWLAKLKAKHIPIVIVSNGSPKRVQYWSQELGLPGFALCAKPLFGFKKALAYLGLEASETAMMGDQLFTDILGAKLVGMKTILVQPLTPGLMPHTRLLRYIETFMLKGGSHGRSFHR